MRTGEAAARSGVNVQTLRYYERLGLLPKPPRGGSGYRAYGQDAVRRVRFIKRAQELGFTLAEIADLLALHEESQTACRRVEARAAATLARIEANIHDLEKMRGALEAYVTACRGERPVDECPLLTALDRPVSGGNGSAP